MVDQPPTTSSEDDGEKVALSLLRIEYTAIRDEIIERIRAERRIVEIALSAFALLVGASVQFNKPAIALVFPALAAGLAAAWAADEDGTLLWGEYVRDYMEDAARILAGPVQIGRYTFLGWDSFFEKRRLRRGVHYWAVRIIFVGSEVLAGTVGALQSKIDVVTLAHNIFDGKPVDGFISADNFVVGVLLIVSVVSIVYTLLALRFHQKKAKKSE